MITYFEERINNILPSELSNTALLGNPGAIKLAIDYFSIDNVFRLSFGNFT